MRPGVNFASYILLKFKLIQAVFLYLIQEPLLLIPKSLKVKSRRPLFFLRVAVIARFSMSLRLFSDKTRRLTFRKYLYWSF